MTENKAVRLAKAAMEFNVGKTTIVEFLRKKGFKEVEDNPNYKLSPDMYRLLEKEYQSEKIRKIEAEKFGKDFSAKPTLSINDLKSKTDSVYPKQEFNEEDELRIKVVSGKFEIRTARPKDKPVSKPVEIIEQAHSEPEIEQTIPPVAHETVPESVEPEKEIQHTPPPQVKIAETISEPIPEPISESIPEPLLEPLQEPELVKHEEVTPEPDDLKNIQEPIPPTIEHDQTEIPLLESKHEIPQDSSHETISDENKAVIDQIQPEPEKSEIEGVMEESEEQDEKVGIKVIGKIDLDSMNLKTKPSKKSKEERKKEIDSKRFQFKDHSQPQKPEPKIEPASVPTPEVIHEPKEIIKPPVEENKKVIHEQVTKPPVTPATSQYPENFIKTEFRKLEGVTIVGKIELPGEKTEKKKPVASSSDDKLKSNKKKKRKRLKTKEIVDTKPGSEASATPGTTGTPGTPGTPGQQPPEKKIIKDISRAKLPPRGKQLLREAPKVEISEKDIAEKIKETHQRLTQHRKSKSEKMRREKRRNYLVTQEEEMKKQEEESKILKVTEFVTVNDLASMLNVPVTKIISTCMSLGLFVSINQRLDAETISLLAEEYGAKVEFVSIEVMEAIEDEEDADSSVDLVPRAPVVTVMGHVDHGKTKLLDYIRHSNVVAGEAGGITQHIGSYEVQLEEGKKISFLDTPGHEAFTAMRARGAKVTDVAIIVIAAEDNVRPQTVEAINHAQAAGVPIVFAINKIDLPTANPEKIKQQLAQMNILIEEYGGKYQCQEISAKAGLNIDLLLEKVLLEAEMLDLKANPKRNAYGTVIESSLDKGRGYVAKILVQNGTLNVGEMVLAGTTFGRVKAMYNERNTLVKTAGPSTPVLLLGLNGAPQAGDKFNVMTDEKEVKEIAIKRLQLQREQGLRTQKHITLDEIGRRIAKGDFKELNVIVKGDVDGSVEALSDSLLRLSNDEVQVNVIHKSVGSITESDVLLASASNAIIIGFQVRPSLSARKLAEREQIDIRLYSIIYSAINELKAAIEGMLAPEIEEKITANLEVRQVFKINKVGTIAGCLVLDGKINRHSKIRVIRDGIVVFTGHLGSLKRFKDDVKDANAGQECGLNVDKFDDIKERDIIESYEINEVARKL